MYSYTTDIFQCVAGIGDNGNVWYRYDAARCWISFRRKLVKSQYVEDNESVIGSFTSERPAKSAHYTQRVYLDRSALIRVIPSLERKQMALDDTERDGLWFFKLKILIMQHLEVEESFFFWWKKCVCVCGGINKISVIPILKAIEMILCIVMLLFHYCYNCCYLR